MRRVVTVGALLLVALSGIVALASSCSEPPATAFGNPNTLDRGNLPGEGGVEALSCSGDGGKEGGSTFDGGCPSFATDIYPYFAAAGTWRCADKACHGGTQEPAIADGTPAACLASLKKITVAKLPYLANGSKDPSASSLLCNLQGACGSRMPKPPGKDPTDIELCKVQAWLACGAPD